jgi:hypothetical protein
MQSSINTKFEYFGRQLLNDHSLANIEQYRLKQKEKEEQVP